MMMTCHSYGAEHGCPHEAHALQLRSSSAGAAAGAAAVLPLRIQLQAFLSAM